MDIFREPGTYKKLRCDNGKNEQSNTGRHRPDSHGEREKRERRIDSEILRALAFDDNIVHDLRGRRDDNWSMAYLGIGGLSVYGLV